MMLKKTFLKFYLFILPFSACQKNESSVPPRDVQVQTIEDNEALVTYLQTHFYNYHDFENDPDNHKIEISLDSLTEKNSDKIALWDQVVTKFVDTEDSDQNIVEHKLYYLIVKKGLGSMPSSVDSTFVSYKGSLLNGDVFDDRDYPIWFDLVNVVRGFRESLPEFNEGNFTINEDGTFDFDNYGKGLIFMPSALGYYSSANSNIPAYSPLIFSVNLHRVNHSDHDRDGILSIKEDINGDGNPLNDDTDGDGLPNMNDFDDDGDGIPTFNELDKDKDGIPDDTDNNGTPDYLDAEVS